MRSLVAVVLLSTFGVVMSSAPLPKFRESVIGVNLKGGYQVIAADLNGDGKPDLIALASGMPELVWYENPGWQRHVIAGGRSQMINVAVCDGPQIVLAEGFSSEARRSSGVVSVLTPQGDVRQPWSIREIDRLPTAHRFRLADIDGSGKKVVVNAPLTAADTGSPDYRGRTPLVYYRPGEWKRVLIGDETEGVMHGIFVTDWDGDGRDEILTASFLGIHVYDLASDGKWKCTQLTKGDPAPWPKSGASDVAVGHLGKRRFLCSIEPWHGNQVVVYLEEKGAWRRQVLDAAYVEGHTIHTADLNGDGRDEILAGDRGKGGHAVYIYTAEDDAGTKWTRHPLDVGGVAAASCAVVDLDGDGRPDIACIGSATANLKIYQNLGR
ncbi:MAG: VCBS repeat-containing protein [Acidobacteria bacterium]|nr:VCBS repeat-containing protein [Acidobacteriota bacterium]